MRHQPHLYLPGVWGASHIDVPAATAQHLSKALRYPTDAPVSFTDGRGTIGTGTWSGVVVERGNERSVPPGHPVVTLAVAPPHSKDRQRFIVEKAQELGVSALIWVRSEHGQTKPPKQARAESWAASALEQSRGAWLLSIREASIASVADGVLADADADQGVDDIEIGSSVTVVVGPEGGWSERESGLFSRRVRLPGNVLRTETAAIVAAGCFLD